MIRLLAVLLLLAVVAPASARCYRCYRCEHRSARAKHAFEVETGYPHGRPGWIIDHWCPLDCGGADDVSNLQWQTKADAEAKDRIEREPCSRFCSVPCPDCG